VAKLAVDWNRIRNKADLNPALSRYARYLERIGLKKNTITLYTTASKDSVHHSGPFHAQLQRPRSERKSRTQQGITGNIPAIAMLITLAIPFHQCPLPNSYVSSVPKTSPPIFLHHLNRYIGIKKRGNQI
jgi:hypothetical protein